MNVRIIYKIHEKDKFCHLGFFQVVSITIWQDISKMTQMRIFVMLSTGNFWRNSFNSDIKKPFSPNFTLYKYTTKCVSKYLWQTFIPYRIKGCSLNILIFKVIKESDKVDICQRYNRDRLIGTKNMRLFCPN